MCCAKAESTRGHYAVVSAVLDGIATVDSTARTEVRGLTSSSERPADILTEAAIPGARAALDVCIAAQDACAAGSDACAAAYRRKTRHYAHLFPQLRRVGVVFQPMVWSAEGRPHPATTRVLESVVKRVKSRKGSSAAAEFRERWKHEIGIAIQRRKAAMLRSVLPRATGRQGWLAGGGSEREDGVLPSLEEEPEAAERDGETAEAASAPAPVQRSPTARPPSNVETAVISSCPGGGPQPAARDIRVAAGKSGLA